MAASIEFRVYPTAAQKDKLLRIAEAARYIFNQALIARRDSWLKSKRNLSLGSTVAMIPVWLDEASWIRFEITPPQLRYACHHVDNIFNSYFKKRKQGAPARLPNTVKVYNPRYDYLLAGDELQVMGIGKLVTDDIPRISSKVLGLEIVPGWYARFIITEPQQVPDDGLTCQRCKQVLPVQAFDYNLVYDKLNTMCRECAKEQISDTYRKCRSCGEEFKVGRHRGQRYCDKCRG